MAEERTRERMLAGAVDRLGDDLSEDRPEDVQARLGTRSCRACEAGPHTCGLPEITDADVRSWAEYLLAEYDREYESSHLTWRDFADQAREHFKALADRGWRRG